MKHFLQISKYLLKYLHRYKASKYKLLSIALRVSIKLICFWINKSQASQMTSPWLHLITTSPVISCRLKIIKFTDIVISRVLRRERSSWERFSSISNHQSTTDLSLSVVKWLEWIKASQPFRFLLCSLYYCEKKQKLKKLKAARKKTM